MTALRPERRDRVRVELDGEPWRTLPAGAVVAAGLLVGTSSDRERARDAPTGHAARGGSSRRNCSPFAARPLGRRTRGRPRAAGPRGAGADRRRSRRCHASATSTTHASPLGGRQRWPREGTATTRSASTSSGRGSTTSRSRSPWRRSSPSASEPRRLPHGRRIRRQKTSAASGDERFLRRVDRIGARRARGLTTPDPAPAEPACSLAEPGTARLPYAGAALPRHHVRLPDERPRLRADQGHARRARARRGSHGPQTPTSSSSTPARSARSPIRSSPPTSAMRSPASGRTPTA